MPLTQVRQAPPCVQLGTFGMAWHVDACRQAYVYSIMTDAFRKVAVAWNAYASSSAHWPLCIPRLDPPTWRPWLTRPPIRCRADRRGSHARLTRTKGTHGVRNAAFGRTGRPNMRHRRNRTVPRRLDVRLDRAARPMGPVCARGIAPNPTDAPCLKAIRSEPAEPALPWATRAPMMGPWGYDIPGIGPQPGAARLRQARRATRWTRPSATIGDRCQGPYARPIPDPTSTGGRHRHVMAKAEAARVRCAPAARGGRLRGRSLALGRTFEIGAKTSLGLLELVAHTQQRLPP